MKKTVGIVILFGLVLTHQLVSLWRILTSLAILLKPIFLGMLLVFLLSKQWKLFLGVLFVVGIATFSAPSFFGLPHANTAFLLQLFHEQSITGRGIYYNQGLLGFLSRTILNPHAIFIFYFFLAFFLFVAVLYFSRKAPLAHFFALLLTFLVLVDPLSWQHHFVFLIFPFFLTYMTIQQTKSAHRLLYLPSFFCHTFLFHGI